MKILKSKPFVIITILFFILVIRHIYCITEDFKLPDTPKKNIEAVLKKEVKTPNDYAFLYEQTGLSPRAIDDFLNNSGAGTIMEIHEMIYEEAEYEKNYILYPFTAEEKNKNQTTPLAPLRDGDILVTFNTMTCDWRHGHCALVVDAENGIMLEHMAIGQTSCLSPVEDWGNYPAFAVLRYPDEAVAKKAAEYAKDHLLDIDYNIFAGFFKKDKSDEEKPESSHCSHIVWQAYKSLGIDIDRDKGFIVTPANVAASEKLEIVQIFGMDKSDFRQKTAR